MDGCKHDGSVGMQAGEWTGRGRQGRQRLMCCEVSMQLGEWLQSCQRATLSCMPWLAPSSLDVLETVSITAAAARTARRGESYRQKDRESNA